MRPRTSAVIVLCALLATAGIAAPGASGAGAPADAVVALIDSGINPYHVAFRDPSPRAQQHPSTYIPGYPADARPLHLTLDAPTYEAAYAADAHLFEDVQLFDLYYVPGTRIVGMTHFGAGGRRCPAPPVADTWPLTMVNGTCPERKLLDDHGHGTMTASRAAAATHALGAGAFIVAIEGLGAYGVQWAGEQEWIDVQSNSWGELVPHPVTQTTASTFGGMGTYGRFAEAATRQIVVAASGNGAGGFFGAAPWPTYLFSTHGPGVISTGAHDNGRVAPWSGAPPHVLADGYAGWMAAHDSLTRFEPDPVACCTSAAAPYAAGAAIAVIREARRLLGSAQIGIRDGVVAAGEPGLVAAGPLADGVFTLAELRAVLLRTAEARPAEGADDGAAYWAAEARAPTEAEIRQGPGGNPYCAACLNSPVRWADIPKDVPAYPFAGYGALNERSVALAARVLAGELPLPPRPVEDALFEADRLVREATL